MTVSFELDGQGFMALNGGTRLEFTESISFMVTHYTNRRWMNTEEKYLKEEDKNIARSAVG
jgi:predicted 3-demethylubiquinone-9 3-methyltransferase (glyoxalase superfamily)